MSIKDIQKKISEVKPTLSDRVVGWFDPVKGVQRRKARVAMALAGGYKGASRSRKAMQTWGTSGGDADTDILYDLPTLRERSRDLVRNNPIATGANNIKVGNVVGTGLKLQSIIDAEYLGLDQEAASEFQKNAEREFKLWAESPDCDITRTLNFYGLQDLAFRSTLENGDTFAMLPYKERAGRAYSLAVQMIESDRVCNEKSKADSKKLAGGIERDDSGAPVRYHIMRTHPGALLRGAGEWDKVDAFGSQTGRRNILHLYRKVRIGQTRGVPDLAPVIEALKQLGDYTEAELTAAIISGLYTVFVHTEGDFGLDEIAEFRNKYGASTYGELKMGPGSVIDLGPNEKIDTANPGRPNQAFDPFVQAILRQVGAALEIPFELLIMQFNSSYSASKAAFETAWTFFRNRRKWLADNFCQPIYEAWMYEAVALGRLKAPGFMRDPAIRQAYLGSQWIGPAKMVLDLAKEANGRAIMEDRGWVTASENTTELTGGDWEQKHVQRTKEHQARVEADLEPRITVVEVTAEPDDEKDNEETNQ